MPDESATRVTSIPVIVDDVKDLPGFPMVRCDYFTIEGSHPPTPWVLRPDGRPIPFLMLGLSGVICLPLAERSDFQQPEDIDELLNAIEEKDGLSVESEFTWLPSRLCSSAKKNSARENLEVRRGDVFRLGVDLFSLSYLFRLNRLPQREFEERAMSLQGQVAYSTMETKLFLQWGEQQISEARKNYIAMSREGDALPWSDIEGTEDVKGNTL